MHQDRKRTTRFIVLSPASPLNDTRRQDQNRHHIFEFSVRVGLPFRTGRTAMVIGKGWTTDLAHGPGRRARHCVEATASELLDISVHQ